MVEVEEALDSTCFECTSSCSGNLASMGTLAVDHPGIPLP